MKKFKIGIVEDHLLFAEGISNLLLHHHKLQVAFISSSVNELFDRLGKEEIDLLILDINLPPYNGLDLINKIKKENKGLKIMILTMYQPIDIRLNMENFQGDAYVLKISGKQILEDAIMHIIDNQPYFDPNIIDYTLLASSSEQKLKLTKREKEIVKLIAEGKTTKEIASLLFLSELTIKTHRKNISEKLDSKGLADMISKSNNLI